MLDQRDPRDRGDSLFFKDESSIHDEISGDRRISARDCGEIHEAIDFRWRSFVLSCIFPGAGRLIAVLFPSSRNDPGC